MSSKIQVKRGTTAQWADSSTQNTTLASGQLGVEYCTDGKTKLKIGPHTEDGSSTEWAEIDYISAGGAEIVKTSATGKSYTINDCAESSIISLDGYGESTQNGTPTPDAPVEIVSIENPVISIYRKNLIPYPYEETTKTINGITFTDNGDGTVTANGTATAAAYFLITSQNQGIETKGLTVTLSGCPVGGSISSYFMLLSYGGNGYQEIGSGLIRTPTEPVTIQLRVASGATVNNITFKPQLEVGSAATAYEPNSRLQTVTVPHTFRGLKNTTTGQWSARDELRVGDGKVEIVRNIKSLTITAENSDSYSFLSGNISGDICRMSSYKNGTKPLFNDMTQDASINYVLCNLFQHYKALQATFGYEGISGTTYTGNIYINVSLTRIGLEPDTTVGDAGIRAAFWNWIKDKNCEINYILAEPTVEDITATEAGQSLLALATNSPVTTVISDIDCNITYLTANAHIDQEYNSNSPLAQSGKAVAQAIQAAKDIKPARIVIGTSQSGYTSADCDYLCGSQASDSDTIQLAINDLKAAGGGEILFLDGDYLVGPLITIQDVNISIKGSGIVTFHQQNTSTVATDGMFKITSSTSTNELYEVVFDNVRFLGLDPSILPPDNYQPSAINCITNTASLTIRNCVADGFNAPGTAAFVCGNGLLPRATNIFENNKIINSYTAIRSYVQYGDLEIINNDIAVSTCGIHFENYTYKNIYIVGNNISVSSGSSSEQSYCVYFPADFNFSGGCELVIKNNTLICGASYSCAIMLQNLPSDYKRKNMIDSNLFTTANNTTPSLTSRGIYLLPALHNEIYGLSISNNIFEFLGTGIEYTTMLSGPPSTEQKNIISNNIFDNLVGSCINIYGEGITSVSNNIGTTLADSAFVGESYVTNSTNNIWNGVPKSCGITAYMDTSLGTVHPSLAGGEVLIPLGGIASSYGNISLSSNAIQIKESGYYYIDGQVMFNNGVANRYMGIRIVQNGDTTLMDAYYSMGSVDYGCVNSAGSIRQLTAGDTVNLYARIPAEGIVINSSTRTKLTVFKLF